MGAAGTASDVTIRGNASNGDTEPLYIIDGVPSPSSPTDTLKDSEIESISILKDDSATHIYGSRGTNGVVVITTKAGLETNSKEIQEFEKLVQDKIEMKPWNPDTPYMTILRAEKDGKAVYGRYLEIRKDYYNMPSFYLDVSELLNSLQEMELASTVVSNLAEIKLDNYELLRALGYQLEAYGKFDQAAYIYERVLELRPEDPQSYRDLALAAEETGDIQRSFELLYKIYSGELLEKDDEELYYGINSIAYIELSRLIKKHRDRLNLPEEEMDLLEEIGLDLRVVIDWNHNDTDIDLWVNDPKLERASFENTLTELGGRLSEDMMDGFGPEEFILKKAEKGRYSILIDYYSDDVQKISGPTILKVTIYTDYGGKNETKKVKVVRLDSEQEELEVSGIIIN